MADDRGASFKEVRDLLGKSDDRVRAILLILEFPGIQQAELATRLGKTPPATKEMLENLARVGFIGIANDGSRPRYRVEPRGERLARGLHTLVAGRDARELIGSVLVCATRGRGREGGILPTVLDEASSGLLVGFGDFRYVAICKDDADLVSALQARIDGLGAESAAIRISSSGIKSERSG